MTSIERTAYPRFKRLITAHGLHVFFTPSEEERAWAEEITDSGEHQLALLLALKSYQRMGCFPKAYDVPDQVVEFVRRALSPEWFPLWVSPAGPGSVHDIIAARIQALPALHRAAAAGLAALADPAYEGAETGVHHPARRPPGGWEPDINARTRNALQRSLCCLVERGLALLTGRWRALQRVTASPSKIGDITRAALVLTHFEHGYIT